MGKMITLQAKIYVTKPYSGKSKFPFWSDMKELDVILVTSELQPPGSHGDRTYQPYIYLTNLRTKHKHKGSYAEVNKMLEKVEYVQLQLQHQPELTAQQS